MIHERNILCFGDSNTWGYQANGLGRLPHSIRYPGVLQELLGSSFYVLEEGLCGRTSAFDHHDRPYTNALSYITPCLLSHAPLDCIIIMLGTNDLKTVYHNSADTICNGLHLLINTMKATCKNAFQNQPDILLIAPYPVDSRIICDPEFDHHAILPSRELPPLLKNLARIEEILFLDASRLPITLAEDGCHLTSDAHAVLAHAIHELLCTRFFL